MASYGFGKLNGNQIEYINGINMNEYYQAGGSFISTKLLQKAILQFSTSGKILYSNQELIDTFGVTRRGLQTAMVELESYGIFKRVFSDPDTKYNRVGFSLDVNMCVDWLKATKKDVMDLERGNLKKHFVMQAVIKIKLFGKELKKLMLLKKSELERKEIQDKISSIHEKQADYEKHVSIIQKKTARYLSIETDPTDKQTVLDTIKSWLKELDYSPPHTVLN